MNRFCKSILVLVVMFFTTASVIAQDSKKDKKELVKSLIQSKKFVFVAQTALPLTGRSINLTSLFDLRVKGDTIISDLPFFGRAYVAPLPTSQGGIRFNSTNNTYTVKDRKKGGWDITISPEGSTDVREMFLRVSEKGYASLQVINTNRQGIGFNGYITSLDAKL